MSEEQENDGTWSGLRKTLIGTLGTVIAGGGTWLGVTLFGGGHDEPAEETKTEQPAAPVIVNVQQNQENKQKTENNNGGGVVRERIIERPVQLPQTQPEKPKKVEEESW